ncbi:MAG TPA: DUF2252 family protein [Labilithrix sp.]|nr:DUF2252 family protein [Labilithrix sp.]
MKNRKSSRREASYPRNHDQRVPLLEQRRDLKMASNAHAYVRGSTARFYEWLATRAGRSLPTGPLVWICGDAHVGNMGPIARSDGDVAVEIRDLDQTVVGNPVHDLVRLSLSLAMAARSSDLPGVITALLVEELMDGYLEALVGKPPASTASESAAVRFVVREANERRFRHLHRDRLGDALTLRLGRRFWPLSKEEREDLDAFLDRERIRTLVTSPESRDDDAEIRVGDAAFWVKGCSSLGLWRCAALVEIVGKKGRAGFSLLDIKQAVSPLAPRARGAKLPTHFAERVVQGALALSPALGERMVWGTIGGRAVFVRELLPQDLKLELEMLDEREARATARALARLLGTAHVRQMDRAHRQVWVKSLRGATSKSIHAPSWLWQSVVDLVGVHERAYLEHCRQHALTSARAAAARGSGKTTQ